MAETPWPRVAVRVDSSFRIGGGHVMRCLVLAQALREAGAFCLFICREMDGDLREKVRAEGFGLASLPRAVVPFQPMPGDRPHSSWAQVSWRQDAEETAAAIARTFGPAGAEWLIYDHYALDSRWAAQLRSLGPAERVFAIDDLDDRPLGAELVLDQSRLPPLGPRRFSADAMLVGPAYALLRPEFLAARAQSLARRVALQDGRPRLLISTGMMDIGGAALRCVEALAPLDVALDVAIGSVSPHARDLHIVAGRYPNVAVHPDARNMAELMVKADLAIGAAGSTTWERLCLGLPGMVFVLADNQRPIARSLTTMGLGDCLGAPGDLSADQLRERVRAKLASPESLAAESRRSAALCDGEGAKRVSSVVMRMTPGATLAKTGATRLRRVAESDRRLLFDWRNRVDIRSVSFNSKPIAFEDHSRWFDRVLQRGDDQLRAVYEESGKPLGYVSAQEVRPRRWRWSFYIGDSGAPRGAGSRMLALMTDYLRKELQAETIYAETLPDNRASERIHEKMGFTRIAPDKSISSAHQRWRLDLKKMSPSITTGFTDQKN